MCLGDGHFGSDDCPHCKGSGERPLADLESNPDNPSSAFQVALHTLVGHDEIGPYDYERQRNQVAAILDALGIPYASESAFVSWAAGQDAYAAGRDDAQTRIEAEMRDFAAEYYQVERSSDLDGSTWFPDALAIIEGDDE